MSGSFLESSNHRSEGSVAIAVIPALVVLLSGMSATALAQDVDFVLSQELTGVWAGDAQWGDFDNDGDLDLVICGAIATSVPLTKTYENRAGILEARQELIGVWSSASSGDLAWGDYDGDGDLDLALAGNTSGGSVARVYENDGSGYLTWDSEQILGGVGGASVAWGDYDNDGDLDLLVTGTDGAAYTAILYANSGSGLLTPDDTVSLTGVCDGSADWADYDNDGDLDLLLTGSRGAHQPRIFFYENDPVGTLTEVGGYGITPIARSDTAWGDYDADGDLDLAINGDADGWAYSRVYRNDDGAFTRVLSLSFGTYASCAWGDYDNDGDLDAAFCGFVVGGHYTEIHENTLGGFSRAFSLWALANGSLTWADVEQDGDLDLLHLGNRYQVPAGNTRLYQNVGGVPNTAPTEPTDLASERTPEGLRLSWSGASDAETPTAGLYYCLRVGTSPGAHDVMSGTYGTPLMGNVGQATEWVLRVPPGTYYWSVRAIDSGLMASPWSHEAATCPYDLDADGHIGLGDLAILLSHYGQWGMGYADGDFTGDGLVGCDDLAILLDAYDTDCP